MTQSECTVIYDTFVINNFNDFSVRIQWPLGRYFFRKTKSRNIRTLLYQSLRLMIPNYFISLFSALLMFLVGILFSSFLGAKLLPLYTYVYPCLSIISIPFPQWNYFTSMNMINLLFYGIFHSKFYFVIILWFV